MQQQQPSSPPSGTHHAYDDELPKQLPEQSDVERQQLLRRVHEEQKSNTRFPLNMFVDCVGADGIRIMGRSAPGAAAAAAAVAAGKHRRKYPPLSRERLEAFLAMTREQHSKNVVMGAVTWDHGTVMFPLGDDYDLVAGFDGGSSKGGGAAAAAAAAATSGVENDGSEKHQQQPPKRNTPPQPTAEELAAAREQQRQRLQERRMRIQNGNLLPPPPPVSFSLRIGRGVGGGNNNNDDDGSEVSSPTFAPTDSEFPATATATSRESAHSSDIARADAVAIEAAMRGLNPMSAQAAMLRAAAIHRREQRLKRRVEQSIILSNLERHEKYGLAEIPAVAAAAGGGNARSAAALSSASALGAGGGMHTPSASNSPGGVGLPSGGGSGAFPANVALPHGSGTPSKTYLAANAAAGNNNNSGMSLKRESSSPTGGDRRLGLMPRVGSRSSIGDATEASSMPELMSATPSEAGLSRVGVPSANSKKQQMPPHGAGASMAAAASSAAPFATTTTTATMGGGSRSSPETPNSKIAARAQQQQQQQQSTTDTRRPPPPPFAEQVRPAAHSSTAPFVKPGANAAAAAIPATASSDAKQQEEDGKSKSNSGDDNDDEQVAAAVGAAAGGCGLTSKDLQRLQRQEGMQMRSRVSVEDFGAAKGRGVRSNGVFAPGALIFRVRPDIGVLYSDHVKHHCAHCFRPSIEGRSVLSSSAAAQHVCLASCDKLVCCPFCECFALCRDCGGVPDLASLEPQSAPVPVPGGGGGAAGGPPPHPALPHLWHRHMLWCRWLRTLPASVRAGDTDYLRFLLEYAARVQHGDARLVESISTLCALEEAQSAEVKSFCDSFSALVSNTFAPQGLIVSRAALREALLRIKCNALGFPFTREATLGWATHSSVCMLNHSCAPAAALTQSPLGEMEVRAVKDIAPAEEVTISYLDLSLPEFKSAKERRRELLTKYLFFCRCPRCTENK